MTPDRAAFARTLSAYGARLAWTLWTLSVVLVSCSVLLLTVNLTVAAEISLGYWFNNVVAAIAFSTVGALIASRRQENIIGWLFGAVGFLYGIDAFAGEYGAYALLTDPGSLSGGVIAVWIASWLWLPTGSLIPFSFLVFPNGRLPSPRWRFIALLAAVGICLATAPFALMPGPLEGAPGSLPISNPFGMQGAAGFLHVVRTVSTPLLGATALVSVVAVFLRFRRAEGDERQQLKWVAYAVVVLAVAVIASSLSVAIDQSLFGRMLFLTGFLAIPVAFGVAILRYRLWDIDLVINRTLVYGALTASVVGIYILVVGYLGATFRMGGNLAISLVATGIVAVLFAPLRNRLQRAVNRLMYGERDEPYKVLSRLGRRLEGSLAPEAVLPAIVEDVARALRLPHVAIWLADGDTLRLGAAYGDVPAETTVRDAGAVEKLRRALDGLRLAGLSASGEYETVLARSGVTLVLPLTHQGELVGALSLAPRGRGEIFSPADRRLLRDVATQSGAAAHAVRLTVELRSSLEDLRRSRERLVAAQEEERRRIQRDLHDGLGPILASMRLRLEACLDATQERGDPLAGALERLYGLVGQATGDIRRLVYDLRPPVLDQLGLLPALRQHCERFSRETGVEVGFEAEAGLTIPTAAEVTLLRIVQEALLNVQKHSHASRVDVRLGQHDGWLGLEIRDNGVGFEANGRADGTGIGSMRERAELLGGTLRLAGHPGAGTEVAVRIPVEVAR